MADPYVGEIRAVAFNFAPDGWLLCNGQVVQVNAYQALYALLGNTYGGTYPSTFGLPDLQGRSILGVGTGVGLLPTLPGVKVGAPATQLTIANLPPHTHAAVVNDPGHSHSAALPNHTHSFAIPCDNGTGGSPTKPTPENAYLSVTTGIDTNINIAIDQANAAATSSGGSVVPNVQNTPLYSTSSNASMGSGVTGNPSATGVSNTGASTTGVSVQLQYTGTGTAVPTQSPAIGLYYMIATMGIFPVRP